MNAVEEVVAVLRGEYPRLEFVAEGQWVRIPVYPLPSGWNRSKMEVAFQIPHTPVAEPYGLFVPSGLLYNGIQPNNYVSEAQNRPPFPGTWGMFSWAPKEGTWVANAKRWGFPILSWVRGFAERFAEGA